MNYNIRSQFLEKVLTITPNYKNPFDDLLHKELYLSLIQTTNTEMIELQYAIKEICNEQ
jgi:hypothetical protein